MIKNVNTLQVLLNSEPTQFLSVGYDVSDIQASIKIDY